MKNLTFKQFDVALDAEKGAFSVTFSPSDGGAPFVLLEGVLSVRDDDGHPQPLSAFGKRETSLKGEADRLVLEVSLQDGPPSARAARVSVALDGHNVILGGDDNRLWAEGTILPGTPASELMSVGLDNWELWNDKMEEALLDLRSQGCPGVLPSLWTVSGPAVDFSDRMIFDRSRDLLLTYDHAYFRKFSYVWEKACYAFLATGGGEHGIIFNVDEDYCRRQYNMPYRGIRRRRGFETPAVGWMTWYAVKFDACEAVVLENARAFKELFGDYLDARPVLWVDWEWCHKALDGLGCPDGDMLAPRTSAYPRGLKALADDLKAMGFLPALWVGPTNDGVLNEVMQAHPEWVLCQSKTWCGQYWFDLTHPQVQQELFPRLFRQYLAWGYEALKWDCIPVTLSTAADHRAKAHDPTMTPMRQLRKVAEIARRTIGEDTYMMSCSGYTESDIEGAMDFFDGARVGGDIFTWQEFLKEGIERIRRFYPFHNTAFYVDADNLVLRKEFSTLEQARSRVSYYGLCGLPVTVGDAIRDLDAPRIDMLRRIMPPIDIRPKTLFHDQLDENQSDVEVVRLSVCRRFGRWTVVAFCNRNETAAAKCELEKDLRLVVNGDNAVYDFWNQRFVGIFSKTLDALEIPPCDTVVLRVTPLERDRPTLLSVSRHITQGGYELVDYAATPSGASGLIRLNPAEPTRLTFLLPEGKAVVSASAPFTQEGQVVVLELPARPKGVYEWEMRLRA